MTLPASGQISMSQVSTELGRASNYGTSLGETAVRNLAGVPSGAISFSNLHGKSAFSFTAQTLYVDDTVTDPADAYAYVTYKTDGTTAAANLTPANWASGGGYTSKYVKATKNSGNTPTGTLDTYLQLSSNRTWSLSQTITGSKSCQLRIDFSHDGVNSAHNITVDLSVMVDF